MTCELCKSSGCLGYGYEAPAGRQALGLRLDSYGELLKVKIVTE
jgi:hypothetical protein